MADGRTTTTEQARTSERSADEIRRDIRRTRREMGETVDALEGRLSPGHLLNEAWGWWRRNSADGPGVGAVVREHPVPVALMGLGLGWLAVETGTGRSLSSAASPDGPGTRRPAEGRVGPYGGDAVDSDDADWEHAGTGARVKAKAAAAADSVKEAARSAKQGLGHAVGQTRSAADSAREKTRSAAETAGERAGRVTGRVRSGAQEAGARARHTASDAWDGVASAGERVAEETRRRARRAGSRLQTLMEENPLVLGALAFGVGIAGALAVPTTRREDRAIGRTADTVKGEARRVGRDVARRAKHVAEDAAAAARDEAVRQKDERDPVGHLEQAARDVEEGAREVMGAAKEAARERAEDEDLTPEGLKDEGRTAGRRTREKAKRDARRE